MKLTQKTIITTLVAAFTAFFISQSVYAKPDGDRTERVVTKITEKLSLDSTQQVLLRSYMAEKSSLKQKWKAEKEARKDSSSANTSDFAAFTDDSFLTVDTVNQAMETRFAKRKADRQASIAAFVNFRNSLSLEQRQEGKKTLMRLFKMKSKGKKGKSKNKGDRGEKPSKGL